MAGLRPILRNLLAGNRFTRLDDRRTVLGQGLVLRRNFTGEAFWVEVCAMGKKKTGLPRSFMSFYVSLVKWTLTEAYGVIDAFLTFVAFALFLVALFNRELAHRLETNWQGLSRWYSIVPVAALLAYRVMKANYAHFENVVNKVDSLQDELQLERERIQQPDIALVWDWPEDQRKTKILTSGTEKSILIANRSDRCIYNVQIESVLLHQTLSFDLINEIKPNTEHVALARWNGRSSAQTNYIYFFSKEENEKELVAKGWRCKKTHNRGFSETFDKIPMALTYDANDTKWRCEFEFIYDVEESLFIKKSGHRV